ncbi:MAG: hypothetical protein PF439_07935 [Helicobacteraceae bacterium]|nr:hypothetical protein [Helicobacteraceae bacterium]
MIRILLISALFFLSLDAGELVVIANKANIFKDRLSNQNISRIYLKKKRYNGSLKLVALNLSASDPLRKEFEHSVLSMSDLQLAAYWAKQHYQGQRPPLSMMSAASVLAFVREVEGAIGYIPKASVDDSVNIIYEVKTTP